MELGIWYCGLCKQYLDNTWVKDFTGSGIMLPGLKECTKHPGIMLPEIAVNTAIMLILNKLFNDGPVS